MAGKDYKTWEFDEDTLTKDFEFRDFKQALDFVNKVGAIAETQQHHPDIILFDYKFVSIITKTHDKNDTVTEKDHQLVDAIEKLIEALN